MRRASAVAGGLALLLLLSPPAFASDDPFGGSGSPGDADSIEFDLGNEASQIQEKRPPERPNDQVAPTARPCARESVQWSSDDPPSLLVFCDAEYHCGGERIDDAYSGRIAGSEATGAYGEYLDYIFNVLASGPVFIGDITDEFRDRFSEVVLDSALGEPVAEMALPVFYYCRVGPGGPLEVSGPAPYFPRFGWDTTVADEYDIDGAADELIDRLRDRLVAAPPEMRAIPPLDQERTFIRFPMWFWLDDPVLAEGLWSQSPGETIRLLARATLDRIEWRWGDTTISCAPDDMKPWVEGLHPYDDRPPCHFIVDELGSYELRATAVYTVEQNVSMRPGTAVPFPDAPWTIASQPEIESTAVVGPIDVRELLALNVNEEITFDS